MSNARFNIWRDNPDGGTTRVQGNIAADTPEQALELADPKRLGEYPENCFAALVGVAPEAVPAVVPVEGDPYEVTRDADGKNVVTVGAAASAEDALKRALRSNLIPAIAGHSAQLVDDGPDRKARRQEAFAKATAANARSVEAAAKQRASALTPEAVLESAAAELADGALGKGEVPDPSVTPAKPPVTGGGPAIAADLAEVHDAAAKRDDGLARSALVQASFVPFDDMTPDPMEIADAIIRAATGMGRDDSLDTLTLEDDRKLLAGCEVLAKIMAPPGR